MALGDILALIATVVSITSLVIAVLSFRHAGRSTHENVISKLNERYCKILLDIMKCKSDNDIAGFENQISALLDLWAHEFGLWQDKRIHTDVFLEWTRYNNKQMSSFVCHSKDGNVSRSFVDIWDEIMKTRKFELATFTSYVGYLLEGDYGNIKSLRSLRMSSVR